MERADRRAACFVALGAGILALPFLASVSMLDEGTIVHIADRLASGEVLYRDVATGVMPGSYYFHALLFLVFGRSLLVGRLFMILLFALASAGVFLLSRGVTGRTTALAAAVSFSALSVYHWRFPGYSPLAICLVFLALAAARAFLDTRRRKWLLLTGLGLGATLLVKQNYGALASLGVAFGLAAGAPNIRRGLRDVAITAVTAAMPVALTAGLFATAGAAAEFWYFTVGVPLQIPSTVFTRAWPPLFGEPDARLLRDIVYYLPFEELALELREWLHAHIWFSMAIIRVTYYLPPLFLLAVGLAWLRRRRRWARDSDLRPDEARELATGALYLGTSVFLILGVFPRVDTHHLLMVLAPSFVLGAWFAGPKPRPFIRRGAVLLASALLILSVLSQIAAIADVHPEQVRDAFLDHPRARIWAERWQVAEIQRKLGQIEERVAEGEPIFVAPAAPMYYFLANRPNPTGYPLILPGALDEEDVVRTLELSPVRYALISDIAFESFPFQYVAPRVWDYLKHHFRPADGAGWDVAPHAPYLHVRGPRAELAAIELLTVAPREAAAGEDAPILSVAADYAEWTEARSLMEPPMSPAPVFQTVAADDWRNRDSERADWQSTYLEPSLVMQAPGGWRKVLVSWEVPAESGYIFEFACALTPWAWASWVEGQGALVEVWIGSSTGTSFPRKVWRRWLNPRQVPADRRWHRAALDLSSFVETGRAVVTLVVGSAPTFLAHDATVAWSSLRVLAPKEDLLDRQQPNARNTRLGNGTVQHMLLFEEEDLGVFREAASRYPDLASAHAALAEVASSLGQHDLALGAIRDAVRVDPEPHYYWIRLGQELQRAGRTAEAIEAIRVAVQNEPTNANYHAALAVALLNDPDGLDQAREASSEAVRLDPANTWAWTLLASVEQRAGDLEAAARAAERSVALEPNKAWPLLALAESLQALERIDEALRALEQAASLDMDPGARSALARILLLSGRPHRARDEALRAMEQDPGSAVGWTVLAQVESALGQWEPAVRAWQEVAALDPSNASARVHLARSLASSSRRDEARDALRAAEALAADHPSRLEEVAIVLDELGWREEALPVWQRVRALAPDGPSSSTAAPK